MGRLVPRLVLPLLGPVPGLVPRLPRLFAGGLKKRELSDGNESTSIKRKKRRIILIIQGKAKQYLPKLTNNEKPRFYP